MNKVLLAIIFLLGNLSAKAQSSKDSINYDVYSISGYRPVVADAIKLNENPVIKDTTKKIPVLTYGITSRQIETPFRIEPIVPAKMVSEPLAKLYRTLVKIGIGNYATPYGEIFFNNLRSKEISYGARYKHLSSTSTLKSFGYSGYSDNEFSLYGKKIFSNSTLTGDFDYKRNVVHAYGYNTEFFQLNKHTTKQRFSLIAPKLSLQSRFSDSLKINHMLALKYYNFNDIFNSAENNVFVGGIFSRYLNKELISVDASVDYYNYQTATDTSNNTIIRINPSIISSGEKFNASIGLGTAIDIADTTNFYFYPRLEASYSIADNIVIPYGGLTGGITKNSFRRLAEENPFILSRVASRSSNNRLELFGGLKGTISSQTSYSTKVSYGKIDDMYFFVNDTTEILQNRFNVIYDDVKLLNLHGEVAYQHTEKLRFLAKADYYKYTLTNELRAWHKPEIEMTFSANYNLKDKIIVKADVFYIGKQFAKISNNTSKQLKPITDINLGLEYRYNKSLSAFINFNNIGATRYYRWNNYPLQKFNLLGGITYSF